MVDIMILNSEDQEEDELNRLIAGRTASITKPITKTEPING